ncbi:hypothetical protein HUJ05_001764, partial [Dendroctonus ponderosae]
ILDNYRGNFHDDKLNRMDIVSRKDISNIKSSFGVTVQDGTRHADDAISVDLYVRECYQMEHNPIVYYKPQGKFDDSGLKQEDFCLILMNKSQQDMLIKFGSNTVAIDSTYGLNSYDFELTTLLVVDEWGEGFPGACLFTNRKDTYIFSLFFKAIKQRIGCKIQPKVFMTVITEVFYNAWKNEMNTVECQLYCAWHVDRA